MTTTTAPPGARARAQRVQDDGAVHVVEIASGLVGEQERRIVEDGAAERDALLLAAGELRRDSAPARAARPNALQQLAGAPAARVVDAADVARREQHVVERGERRREQERLEDEADVAAARRALRAPRAAR